MRASVADARAGLARGLATRPQPRGPAPPRDGARRIGWPSGRHPTTRRDTPFDPPPDIGQGASRPGPGGTRRLPRDPIQSPSRGARRLRGRPPRAPDEQSRSIALSRACPSGEERLPWRLSTMTDGASEGSAKRNRRARPATLRTSARSVTPLAYLQGDLAWARPTASPSSRSLVCGLSKTPSVPHPEGRSR